MLPILYAVFPKEYKRFIEVFGGSGAVLLGHEPVDFEVYNDVDGELVNCFRVIRNRPASFLLELGMLPLNSREEFASWLKFQNPGSDPVIYLKCEEEIMDRLLRKEWAEPLKEAMHMRADYPEVLRAANYLKRVRNSYSSSGRSFACQPFNVCTLFDQIWEMSARLANVVVEQQSFEVLIPHYDRPDSFFYGAVLRGSCLEGMTVEAGVLEQADTRNVSFHECDWIEEAVSAKKPAMEMGGM